MNETRFSSKFRNGLRDTGQWTTRNFQRTQSEPSCPDVLCLHATGFLTWVELKVLHHGEGKVYFQPGQPQWHENWIKDGGVIYVLTLVGESLWLTSGVDSRSFASTRGISESVPPDLGSLRSLKFVGRWAEAVGDLLRGSG